MDLIKGFFSQKFDIFFANFKIKSSKMVKIISYIRLKIKFILKQTLLKNAENYTCYCSIFSFRQNLENDKVTVRKN